jgi:14-3-3 protein epsilon
VSDGLARSLSCPGLFLYWPPPLAPGLPLCMQNTSVCAGWLWKQGQGIGASGTFKRRWFVLEVEEGKKPSPANTFPPAGRLVTLHCARAYPQRVGSARACLAQRVGCADPCPPADFKQIDDEVPTGSIALVEGRFHLGRPKQPRGEFEHTLRLDVELPSSPGSPRSAERGKARRKYILAAERSEDKLRWESVLGSVFNEPDNALAVSEESAPPESAPLESQQRAGFVLHDTERCVLMAEICWQAKRYDDMAAHTATLVMSSTALNEKEEELFCRAFYHCVGERRTAWRQLSLVEYREESSVAEDWARLPAQDWATLGHGAVRQRIARVTAIREKLEEELTQKCHEVLKLLEHLIPRASSSRPASRINYLKLAGDYHRYLAEFCCGPARKTHAQQALSFYQSGQVVANKMLAPDHTIRLGLALNYTALLAEVLGTPSVLSTYP